MEERERRGKQLTETIIGAAIRVHRELGPGLLESVYEACLAIELEHAGVPFVRQRVLPVVYRGVHVDAAYRMDLVVDDFVVVETKAVETLTSLHEAQLLTYLRLSGLPLGLLLNFNVELMKQGVRRLVHRL
jgi:GxxExxY protein